LLYIGYFLITTGRRRLFNIFDILPGVGCAFLMFIV
jgi:hypothetical protein